MPKTLKLKKVPFKAEADLCAAFIRSIDKREWTTYCETAGWDILMVRKADGFQIGIEAKLKLNAHVFAQAVKRDLPYNEHGPDCRAILVPTADIQGGIGAFCAYVGVTIIAMREEIDASEYPRWQHSAFTPNLPRTGDEYSTGQWYPWCPLKRHKLPEYVPDVEAGHPSPLRLTKWKIAALKIAILLDDRGYVTRSDFRHVGIDIRRWMPRELAWLTPSAEHQGFVRGQSMPDFSKVHPRNYQQVKDDLPKWRPKLLVGDKLPPARLL